MKSDHYQELDAIFPQTGYEIVRPCRWYMHWVLQELFYQSWTLPCLNDWMTDSRLLSLLSKLKTWHVFIFAEFCWTCSISISSCIQATSQLQSHSKIRRDPQPLTWREIWCEIEWPKVLSSTPTWETQIKTLWLCRCQLFTPRQGVDPLKRCILLHRICLKGV